MARLTETELLQTDDAKVWAEQFMLTQGLHLKDVDEELMTGWFANSMTAANHQQKESAKLLLDSINNDKTPWSDATKTNVVEFLEVMIGQESIV